jgi:methionyl-tRNA formyltransferase
VEALTDPASLNIVFAGTSPFAVPALEALCAGGYRVTAVVTQPDRPKGRGQTLQPPPVKVAALARRLPIHQPVSLRNDEAPVLFEGLRPDLLVVVAYGKILPPWLLALPRHGALNLHGSLLPRYRGAAPIQWAMANGEKETGVCLMQVDEGLDTGPVFACVSTPIDPDESIAALSERLAALGADLLLRCLKGIVDGSLRAQAQDNTRASLAPMLTKQHGLIDWNLGARSIHDRVRAFQPWPGARAGFRGMPLRILRTRVVAAGSHSMPPGVIVLDPGPPRSIGVVCGDGRVLELLEVQLPNRKPQSGLDFLNGLRVAEGEKLDRLDEAVSDNSPRG